MKVNSRAILCALATAAIALPGFAGIQGDIRKSFTVLDGGHLRLVSDIGSISVHPGAGQTVDINVKREADSSDRKKADEIFARFDVSLQQQGNDVIAHVSYRNPISIFNFRDDVRVHLDVTVPAHYNIDIRTSGGGLEIGDLSSDVAGSTSGGGIHVGHIDGNVDVRTSGGSIDIDSATRDMKLHTSGGGIHIGDAGATSDVRTSGGSITVLRSHGSLFAHTSGGGIRIDDASGTIDAASSGGSVSARITGPLRADSKLQTSGGGVNVSLATTVSANVDAHSSGGGVESEVPIVVVGRQEDSTLRGTLNGGGPQLVLRSSGGSVRLRKL